MKKISLIALILAGLLDANSPAQTTFSDSAASSAYNGGIFIGRDGGTGFGSWTQRNQAGGGGTFMDGTSAFAIYAGGGTGNAYAVGRSFDESLLKGSSFSIQLGYTGVSNGGEIGISFLSGGNTRLTYKFVGGDSFWKVNDGGSDFDSSIGWGGGASGLPLLLTLTRGTSSSLDNQYTLSVSQGASNWSGNNYTAGSGSMDINEIRLFSNAQGSDQNLRFNNLNFNQVPEPSSASLLTLGVAGLIALRRRRNA